MNEKHFVGSKVSSFERYDDIGPITGIALVVDDENEYQAGNQTGYVLEIECPYGTQTMANNILANVQGKTYKGFRATGVQLPASAELGDGVTANGVYSMLAYRDVKFGSGHRAEIAAPGENVLEHEYPYLNTTTQKIARKIAQTYSEIKKTTDAIELSITGLNGEVSSLKVTLEGVTVTGTDGTTKIKGSVIETGSLNLTGIITWNDLDSDTQNQIGDAYDAATDAQTELANILLVSGGQTYIDGSRIYTNSIYADAMHLGGSLAIYKSLASAEVGGYLGYTTSANDGSAGMHMQQGQSEIVVTANGAKLLYALDSLGTSNHINQIYVTSSYATMDIDGSAVSFSGASFTPSERTTTLGLSGSPWGQIYSTNSTISTSDKNEKTDISYDMDEYIPLFLALKPSKYRFVSGTSGRIHTGFIAQDVETAIYESGLNSMELAAFIKSPTEEGEYHYGLRYEELIALNTYMIQQLMRRIEILEAQRDG